MAHRVTGFVCGSTTQSTNAPPGPAVWTVKVVLTTSIDGAAAGSGRGLEMAIHVQPRILSLPEDFKP